MNPEAWSGRLRVRSCGVLVENDEILLAEIKSPVTNEIIFTPPGGGVEFGESLSETLIREFKEETSVLVDVKELIHVEELIEMPFHAIQFYHLVERKKGNLELGNDPELEEADQILRSVKFYGRDEIQSLNVVPGYFRNQFWEEHCK